MPGCFSRLRNKFSKNATPKPNAESNNSPAGQEPVNSSGVKPKPNDVLNDSSAGNEPLTSPQAPGAECPEKQASAAKDRWREAFEQLPADKQQVLKEMGFADPQSGSVESSVDDLVSEVNKKQEECEKKFWHVNINGEKIVLREYTTQILGWLEKAGDIAVQFAPPQASLPWSVVKSMMKIPVNEDEQMGALLATTERVVRITSRGQVYENVYLPQTPDAQLSSVQKGLESSLVGIYKTALDLLVEAKTLLSTSTPRRMLEAIVSPGKAKDNLSGLAGQEDELLRDVQACESKRSSDSDKRANAMLEALQAPMARVDKGISHLLQHVSESERIQLLEWISPIPFGQHHDTVREARTPGTGEWLLKHQDFRNWDTKRSSSLFWLQGNPGSGKTYLTSTVIDQVRAQTSKYQNDEKHRNDEGFAFFYCKRDDKPRDQPLAILQSFVRQLSTTAGNPESMQIKLQETCMNARESATDFRFAQCKEQILASLNLYQRTTLVIDAMDECDPDSPDSRYELIEALKSFLSGSKRVMRIFISSRPDPNIQSQLESSPNVGIRSDDNQGDIEKFLHDKLDKLAKVNSALRRLKSQIIAKLLERCQGMFQWADMQIHQIAKCGSPPDIWKRLENLPEDLQKTYDEVWRQIEGQGEYDQVFTKRALRWVMAASKPMTSVEILAAIRMGQNGDILPLLDTVDEQSLLSLCNNFLVVDPQLKVWRFPHLSVREYLQAKDEWSTAHADYHAVSVCLSYFVNKYEHDDGSDLDAKLAAQHQMEIHKPEDIDEPARPAQSDEGFHILHPFHVYMRHNWAHHIRGAQDIDTVELAALLKTFLGSPNKSSTQYQRWHRQTGNDFAHLSSDRHVKHYIARGAKSIFSEISPGDAAGFAMCRFSLAAILWDWWESAEIDISRVNDNKDTLLALAVKAGCLPICKKLLQTLDDQGADANTRSEFFGISLHIASSKGNEEIVEVLLNHGADVNAIPRRNTALQSAAFGGNQKIVQMLLDQGADVNAQVGRYCTALHAASMRDNEKCVQVLLDHGANADIQSENFGHALLVAATEGSKKAVQIMLDRGVNVNTQSQFGTAIEVAAFRGDEKMVQMLLDRGADVNAQGEYVLGVPWGTALEAASSGGTEKIVQMVLDRGADVNASNAQGNSATALQGASFRGIPSIVQILLDHGADVNDKGVDGDPPLIAAMHGYNGAVIVQMLLDRGADANAQSEGSTVLQRAASAGDEAIVKLLLDHGADVNAQGQDGTALHCASSAGNEKIVQMLLGHGAVASSIDK